MKVLFNYAVLILFMSSHVLCQQCLPNNSSCQEWSVCCSGCCKGYIDIEGNCVEDENNCICNPCTNTNCVNLQCIITKSFITTFDSRICIKKSECVDFPYVNDPYNPCNGYRCPKGEYCFIKYPSIWYKDRPNFVKPICGVLPSKC